MCPFLGDYDAYSCLKNRNLKHIMMLHKGKIVKIINLGSQGIKCRKMFFSLIMGPTSGAHAGSRKIGHIPKFSQKFSLLPIAYFLPRHPVEYFFSAEGLL